MNNLIAVYPDNKEVLLTEFWQQKSPIKLPREDSQLNYLGRQIKWLRTNYPDFSTSCFENLKTFQSKTFLPDAGKWALFCFSIYKALKMNDWRYLSVVPSLFVLNLIANALFNPIVKEYELQVEDNQNVVRLKNSQDPQLKMKQQTEEDLQKFQDILSTHQKVDHFPVLVPSGDNLRSVWDRDVFRREFKNCFPQAHQLSVPIVVSKDGEKLPFLSLRIRPKQQGCTQQEPFFITFFSVIKDLTLGTIMWAVISENDDPYTVNQPSQFFSDVLADDKGNVDVFQLLEDLVTGQHPDYELDFPPTVDRESE